MLRSRSRGERALAAPAFDAVALLKPVIAAGYSGNLAFMTHDNSILAAYNIVEIAEDRSLYTKGNFWAEPSIEHAAASMRPGYENRDEARGRALRVQPAIQQALFLQAAERRMAGRLQQIGASARQP